MTHPYFVSPLLKALRETSDPRRRDELRMLIAVNIGDPSALRELFGLDSESLAGFYPDTLPLSPTTDDTIAGFLATFGAKSALSPLEEPEEPAPNHPDPEASRATEQPEAHAIPIVPAADYALSLEEEDAKAVMPADDTADAISAFLHTNPAPVPRHRRPAAAPEPEPAAPAAPKPEPEPEPAEEEVVITDDGTPIEKPEPTLSESFARIMIRNGNYAKALEILEKSNPDSPCHEDRLRFLRKLMANAECGMRNNSDSTVLGHKDKRAGVPEA